MTNQTQIASPFINAEIPFMPRGQKFSRTFASVAASVIRDIDRAIASEAGTPRLHALSKAAFHLGKLQGMITGSGHFAAQAVYRASVSVDSVFSGESPFAWLEGDEGVAMLRELVDQAAAEGAFEL